MKYHAKKTAIDGIMFDSKKEAQRYSELKLLIHAGQISDLELQVPFILQDAFRKDGVHYPAIKYIADFVYRENGRMVVEDTKGYRTKEYRIKKKLFEKRYPDLTITEV